MGADELSDGMVDTNPERGGCYKANDTGGWVTLGVTERVTQGIRQGATQNVNVTEGISLDAAEIAVDKVMLLNRARPKYKSQLVSPHFMKVNKCVAESMECSRDNMHCSP